MHPSARRADVIVQEAGPDMLVYDQLRDTAHSLSAVTGYVYRNANGSRSIAELTAGMSGELGVTDDPELVSAALSELQRVNLLEESAPPADLISRRAAVRRVGTAALALAAITTIAAPTPAMAKSWGNIGGPKKGNGRGSSNGRGPGGNGPPGQNRRP